MTEIRQEIRTLKSPSTPGNDGEILQQLTTIEEFDSCENTLKEKSGERHKVVTIFIKFN